MRLTDRIRQYIRVTRIEPARLRGEMQVRVVAGEIHRELRLKSRVPMVCNALSSRELLDDCGLSIVSEEGPPSGLTTTVAVVYSLAPGEPGRAYEGSGNPLWGLRGVAKELFAKLGGGEAFIRAEREAFSGGKGDPE